MTPTVTGGSGAPGRSVPTDTCVGACHGETRKALVCNCSVIACITGASKDEAIGDGLGYPTVDGCMRKKQQCMTVDDHTKERYTMTSG